MSYGNPLLILNEVGEAKVQLSASDYVMICVKNKKGDVTCPDVDKGCYCLYDMPASSLDRSHAVRNMENTVGPNSTGHPP